MRELRQVSLSGGAFLQYRKLYGPDEEPSCQSQWSPACERGAQNDDAEDDCTPDQHAAMMKK
jgi:hypothetical protein